MAPVADASLSLSRGLLRVCRALNILAAAVFFVLLAVSYVHPAVLVDYLRINVPGADPASVIPILRAMVLVGAPMFALVHVLLSRVLEMTETVRSGDPFVPENAARLRSIAWCLLLIQLLHLGFGVLARLIEAENVRMEWEFSVAGWLAVLLTFVLARVFEEGARLRGDMQAMI